MKNRLTQHVFAAVLVCGLAAALTGCDQGASPSAGGGNATPEEGVAASLPETVMLTEAPADPASVADLKKSAKEGDEVVVRVVVGGRVKPFVENRAIMTVVDAGFENACLAPGDSCQTPWDYCCAATEQLRVNMATVQVTGDDGRPLKVNLAGSPRIKPQTTIIVKGTVGPRPDPEALVVNASGIYVESAP